VNSLSSEKRKYELKARADGRQRTRERIAAAAAELHEERGVSRTTVADIARRAGVQRLTVYNHFPDLAALLPACSAHYLALHPLPELGAALAIEEPRERVREVLSALYGWYRGNEAIQLRMQGERATVPELEDWMARTADVRLRELASGLAGGFALRGERADRLRAHLALALDFWTWHRLDREGLADEAAADLMAESLAAVAVGSATPPAPRVR
jgi:AcrR family transcriptional regulator